MKPRKLAVLDFETSGLDTSADEPIEMCCQIWTPETGLLMDPENTFYRLFLPTGPVHPKAAEVNGYTKEKWLERGARPLCDDDLHAFNAWLAGHAPQMWCGHNAAKFDLPIMHTAYKKARVQPHTWRGDHRVADTQALAVPLFISGEIESVGLEQLCAHFGIVNPAPHTAPGDVWTCVQVLERLCARSIRGAQP